MMYDYNGKCLRWFYNYLCSDVYESPAFFSSAVPNVEQKMDETQRLKVEGEEIHQVVLPLYL